MMTNVVLVVILDALLFMLSIVLLDGVYLNPKSNYEKWYTLNWFGVLFLTVLYWVIFLPVSVAVGMVWVVYKLFTVGRK